MLFDPYGRFKIFWDSVILVATLYVSIEAPYRLTYNLDPTEWAVTLDYFVTVLFAIDIFINFRTRYKVKTQMISDKKKIAFRYLKGWFWIDFISTIPFDLVARWIGITDLGFLRVAKILRLFRLLRFIRIMHFFIRVEGATQINPIVFRFIVFAFVVTLASHWITCGWLALGSGLDVGAIIAELKTKGIDVVKLGVEYRAGIFAYGGSLESYDFLSYEHEYLRGLYWCITTLTTVGYGDISPVTDWQTIYTMIIMMVGVGVYGYVIGNVSTLLGQIDLSKVSHTEKVKKVNAFLRYKNIPRSIRDRVNKYYEHVWEYKMGGDEADILMELPESMRTEIALHLNKGILEKVPLFKGASNAFISDIALHLRPRVMTPGDNVVRKGEIGYNMYFIWNGNVEVVSEDGSQVYATLGQGSFFGEIALLMSTPRTATIRAVDYCDLYSLEKEAFEHVLQNHPRFAEHIQKETEKRIAELGGRGEEPGTT